MESCPPDIRLAVVGSGQSAEKQNVSNKVWMHLAAWTIIFPLSATFMFLDSTYRNRLTNKTPCTWAGSANNNIRGNAYKMWICAGAVKAVVPSLEPPLGWDPFRNVRARRPCRNKRSGDCEWSF